MTERVGTLRRRRRVEAVGLDGIPEEVRAWFAAGCPDGDTIPWPVLLPQTCDKAPGWWQSWCASNPGATAPSSVDFLLKAKS